MVKSIKEIKKEALTALEGKWKAYIVVGLLGFAFYEFVTAIGIIMLIIPGLIVSIFGSYALANISLIILEGKKPKINDLFNYKEKLSTLIGISILLISFGLLITLPLGIYMVINPGTLVFYFILITTYAIQLYITIRLMFISYLIRDFDLKPIEVINESVRLTKGNFLRITLFYLSFIGWIILIPATLGLLAFWLYPYLGVSSANLYKTIYYEKLDFDQ